MGKPHRRSAKGSSRRHRRARRAEKTTKRQRQPQPESDVIFHEDGTREFVPWADNFGPGVNLAEAKRATSAKLGFLDGLLNDSRVWERFTRWLDALKSAPPDDSRLQFDVLELMRELGISWPWCEMEIREAFQRMVLQKRPEAVGERPEDELAVHAPSLMLFLCTEPSETTAELRERVTEIYRAAIAQIDETEAEVKGGKTPKGGGEHLRRWGRWFYKAHIARPTRNITDIARENHAAAKHPRPFEECDCRAQINKGIAEAERLLSLGEFTLSGKKNPR